ncbi:MAG TPA: hypothetical protein VHL09_13535, partial [Dehalococcoidia bacterium]|nr:hypothetical protein [Dehalococcoidia bacterium]
ERHWKAALTLLDAAPEFLHPIHPGHREGFLALARQIAEASSDEARALCLEAAPAFREIDPTIHGDLIRIAGEIRQIQPGAAVAFLRSAPALLRRTATAGVEQWVREGSRVLRRNVDAGNAYFRIESARAEQALAQISRGVELQSVRDLLRLYSKALTGRDISIRSAEDLADQALGWTSAERPTTEGSAIFLPPYLEHFAGKDENFAAYKVLTTHQAGHLEFGTFRFRFDRAGAVFPAVRTAVAAEQTRLHSAGESAPLSPTPAENDAATGPGGDATPSPPVENRNVRSEGPGGEVPTPDTRHPTPFVDFERFFDLFGERALAKDLFAVIEDNRIDARIRGRYRGLRRALAASQRHALEARPDLLRLTVWTGLVEVVLQDSLGRDRTADLPARLRPLARKLIEIARRIEDPAAEVEDSVEATLQLYALITQVPNVPLIAVDDEAWSEASFDLPADLPALAAGIEQGTGEGLPVYESVQDVDFRGDLKPELVQTLMKIREDG